MHQSAKRAKQSFAKKTRENRATNPHLKQQTHTIIHYCFRFVGCPLVSCFVVEMKRNNEKNKQKKNQVAENFQKS